MTEGEKEILQKAEDIRRNEKKKRKGMFTKFLIVFIFAYLFYFAERVFVVFKLTGTEPTMLITSVFAILGLECGVMGWIKNTKVKKGDK